MTFPADIYLINQDGTITWAEHRPHTPTIGDDQVQAYSKPTQFNGYLNTSLLLLDRVIDNLETGFVSCQTCGDQEDTKTLDVMDDLKLMKGQLELAAKEAA